MQLAQSRTRVVYYTSFATDFAYFAFLFSITRWLAESGSSQWHLGIFGACASISYAMCGPLAGMVSDRFGRRRVMLCGAALTIAVLVACSAWRSRPLFYSMAAACGFSVSLIFPPLIAWLTEDGRDTSRRLLLFCVAWNGGVMASQLTAGWLYQVRPELPLLTAVVPMAGIIVVMAAWKPPPAGTAPLVPAAAPAREARARTFVYLGWLSNGAGALSFSLVTHLFPYLAHESGISPPVHGAMLAANRVAVIATYFVMFRFAFWRFRLWTAITSQVVAMAGLALLGFSSSIPLLTIGLMLTALMLGYNYFASIYYSTMAFGNERKGIASGIHEGSLAIGGAMGALGGGWIGAVYGARVPYRVCVVLLGTFVVVQLLIHRIAMRRTAQLVAVALAALTMRPAAAADAVPACTARSTLREPLDEVMVAGIDRYCLRAISAAREARNGFAANRERFRDQLLDRPSSGCCSRCFGCDPARIGARGIRHRRGVLSKGRTPRRDAASWR